MKSRSTSTIWILSLLLVVNAYGELPMSSSHYGPPMTHPMLQEGINSFGQAVLQYMASIQRQHMSDQYRQPESEVPIPHSFGSKQDNHIPQLGQPSNYSEPQNNALSLHSMEEVALAQTKETPAPQPEGKIYKHVYVHSAPEEPQELKPRKPLRMKSVLPPPEKHYRILFIKAPSASVFSDEEIEMPPPPEQRTLVYVLLPKSTFGIGGVNLAYPKPRVSKPEVYFIRYKGGQGQQKSQSLENESKPETVAPKVLESHNEWSLQKSQPPKALQTFSSTSTETSNPPEKNIL